MSFLTDVSSREKHIWANLILDGAIAINFFPKLLRLEGSLAENTEALGLIVGAIIVMSILGSIAIHWLLDIGKEEKQDERDRHFAAMGYQVGYLVVCGGIVFLIGHMILNAITTSIFSFQYESLTRLRMATYLMLTLVGAAIAKDVTRLFYYRRGY